ncbi:MAG: AEC family transporter [Oscillospiraceae bacterium]|jgi:predicted permease|nr:AEC family transporter [Oscillospiraceae bacterium]
MNTELFFSNAGIAFKNLVILYVIVAIGAFASKIGWFREEIARSTSKLLFYIITPCVIIKAFIGMEYSSETVRNLGIAVAAGFLLHISGILISAPFFRGKKDPDTDAILHYAAVYGNCGYMSLPLAQAMIGEAGVFYCTAVILTFQVFAFTHGTMLMEGKNRPLPPDVKKRPLWQCILINAGVVSVAIGLPIFLLRIPVPEVISTPISYVGSMNTPLAMLMFGSYLSNTKLSTVFKTPKLFITIGIKLIAIPAVVLAALLAVGAKGALLNALLISASAPSANNTVAFAGLYERGGGYAAQAVAVVSFLSIISMPLIIAFGLSVA